MMGMIGQEALVVHLFDAVKAGKIEKVKEILGKNPKLIGAKNKQGLSLLHVACEAGWVDIVETIVSRGANINEKDELDRIPLHFAAGRGHRLIVKFLMSRGADVTVRDKKNSDTPAQYAKYEGFHDLADELGKHADYDATPNGLIEAIKNNQFDTVQAILNLNPDLLKARNDVGDSTIHAAALSGSVRITQMLLSLGVDVNEKNKTGDRPLHFVTTKEVADLLIKAGADVTATDNYKNTPLHRVENREIAALFLAKGADLNAKNEYRNTPLQVAEWAKKNDVVELFLTYMNVQAFPEDLFDAVNDSDLPWMQQLLEINSNLINEKDFLGQTALHRAVTKLNLSDKEIIQFLLDNGADVKARDFLGNTPLHKAATREAAQMLLTREADLEARNSEEKTPLHTIENLKTVEFLVETKADVNAADKNGRTPLHLAAFTGNLPMTRLLLSAGANLVIQDKNGWTPLIIAQNNCQDKMADFLYQFAEVISED
jgi:ankyrin repeat protein